VRDYRVLLDWIVQQPPFDATQVRAAGYSMGAQMALLLAATDGRVHSVAAMVPPHLDRKVAVVAPSTLASRLATVEVWLLTADGDDYASRSDNAALFAALPGPARKQHLRFPGGHVLPPAYVDRLRAWLTPPAVAAGAADAAETTKARNAAGAADAPEAARATAGSDAANSAVARSCGPVPTRPRAPRLM
jgi:dienelactone hydrolase